MGAGTSPYGLSLSGKHMIAIRSLTGGQLAYRKKGGLEEWDALPDLPVSNDVSVDYIGPIWDANKPHYCATAGTGGCHRQQQDIAKWRRHCAPMAGGGIVDLKRRRSLRRSRS